MNLKRLYEILGETTVQLRKGERIEGDNSLVDAIKRGDENLPGGVVSFYMMPDQSEAPADLEKVDVEFIVIGVDRAKAEGRRAELIALMHDYPSPDRLNQGPSYIEVGGALGDQGAAFQLFALGKVLGFWNLITPKTLGFSGEEAREMAGRGFIMIDGYRPNTEKNINPTSSAFPIDGETP